MPKYPHLRPISSLTLLAGVLLGLGTAYLLLLENAPWNKAPWLVLGVAGLAGLVAKWQTPCIQAVLNTTHNSKNKNNSKKTKHKIQNTRKKRFPCLARWVMRLTSYLLILSLAVLAETYWWVSTPVTMIDFQEDRTKPLPSKPLPSHYALKRLLWQLGIPSLPKLATIHSGSFQREKQTVFLYQDFMMSQYEITFAEYDYYVWSINTGIGQLDAKKSQLDETLEENSKKTSQGIHHLHYPFDEDWGRDTRPVININWHDAQGYVNWLGKKINQSCRLPSEAEWEYAARAGTKTNYPWGDDIGQNKANCDGCGSQWDNKQTAPVGSFDPNKNKLHDMHGNVWEWVQDCYADYSDNPYPALAHEEADCKSGRVLRGGSWFVTPDFLRSSYRDWDNPDNRNFNSGFRVVCVLPSAEN